MKKEKNVETMLVLTLVSVFGYLVFKHKYFLLSAIIFGCIGVFSNFLSRKISWVWLKFAHLLGLVNSKVLLGAIFFIFLTPIAFFMKLLGKTNINLNKKSTSYFVTRNHEYNAGDIENIW